MSVKKIGEAVLNSKPYLYMGNASLTISWTIKGGQYDFFIDDKYWANEANKQIQDGTFILPEPVAPLKDIQPPKKRELTPKEKLFERLWGRCKYSQEYAREYDAYQKKLRERNKQIDQRAAERKKLMEEKKVELAAKTLEQIEAKSFDRPLPMRLYKDRHNHSDLIYCLYKGNIYKFDRIGYSEEEMLFQIMELEDKERQKFERLKHRFTLAKDEEKEQTRRERIPEEVRIAVWRRDEGKCVKCDSRERLEYDHIIPLSKGGSDTVRNIELLCEKCNREKRDNIQ